MIKDEPNKTIKYFQFWDVQCAAAERLIRIHIEMGCDESLKNYGHFFTVIASVFFTQLVNA